MIQGIERIDPLHFQDKIEWLWEKVKTQTYALDDTAKKDCTPFLHLLFSPGTEHYYNQSGMVSAVQIQPRMNANLHFMVWDRKFPTKEVIRIGKEIITHLFETYDLNRITATIPSINKGACSLSTLLGMKFEGTMREAFLHDNNYLDMYIYGLLKRDWKETPNGWRN